MNTPNPHAVLHWIKSSRSSDEGACVEIADARTTLGRIALRDSKITGGPVLFLRPAAFTSLLTGVRNTPSD